MLLQRLDLNRGSLSLTEKPEEEAIQLREWAEVQITWFDWSDAERWKFTWWKRFSDQIETDD